MFRFFFRSRIPFEVSPSEIRFIKWKQLKMRRKTVHPVPFNETQLKWILFFVLFIFNRIIFNSQPHGSWCLWLLVLVFECHFSHFFCLSWPSFETMNNERCALFIIFYSIALDSIKLSFSSSAFFSTHKTTKLMDPKLGVGNMIKNDQLFHMIWLKVALDMKRKMKKNGKESYAFRSWLGKIGCVIFSAIKLDLICHWKWHMMLSNSFVWIH